MTPDCCKPNFLICISAKQTYGSRDFTATKSHKRNDGEKKDMNAGFIFDKKKNIVLSDRFQLKEDLVILATSRLASFCSLDSRLT